MRVVESWHGEFGSTVKLYLSAKADQIINVSMLRNFVTGTCSIIATFSGQI